MRSKRSDWTARVLTLLIVVCMAALMAFGQATAAKPAPSQSAPTAKSAMAAADKLDINSATKDQLKQLPGIGDAYSQKIIDPQATYDKIKDVIIAKQSKADKMAPSPK